MDREIRKEKKSIDKGMDRLIEKDKKNDKKMEILEHKKKHKK